MKYASRKTFNHFCSLADLRKDFLAEYLDACKFFTLWEPRPNSEKAAWHYDRLFKMLESLNTRPVVYIYWAREGGNPYIKTLMKHAGYLMGNRLPEKFEGWLNSVGPSSRYNQVDHQLKMKKAPPASEPCVLVENKIREGMTSDDLKDEDEAKQTSLWSGGINQLMGMPCLRELCTEATKAAEEREGIVWI